MSFIYCDAIMAMEPIFVDCFLVNPVRALVDPRLVLPSRYDLTRIEFDRLPIFAFLVRKIRDELRSGASPVELARGFNLRRRDITRLSWYAEVAEIAERAGVFRGLDLPDESELR